MDKYQNMTFKELLDAYFFDHRIKAVFDVLILYIGLTSETVSAVTALILFRDFILDGGFYPVGGMQSFPNALTDKFISYGGDIVLSERADKIVTNGNKCVGIRLVTGESVNCDCVISNVSAIDTFTHLLDETPFDANVRNQLHEMKSSVSHFITFLGIKKEITETFDDKCNLWFVPNYNIQAIYENMLKCPLKSDGFIHMAIPSFHDAGLAPEGVMAAFLTILSPFETTEFWRENRKIMEHNAISRVEKFIPGFASSIVYAENSTPHTIYRYTRNTAGANYGWAMTPSQSGSGRLPQETNIEGLYLAGHWTQPGCGIATVAASGYTAAKMVMKYSKQNSGVS
jgi:prolycopene isomerase